MTKKKVVITGGGTGGHVFPALAIAEELRKRKISVLYVGSASGMESTFVPQKGFPFYTVASGAIKNQNALKKIGTVIQLIKGVFWAVFFLRRERPDLTLGVGGYVSFPVCFASFILGIPVYLQEQNASVGIANRLLGKIAQKIFLGFQQAEEAFSAQKCLVTGNPLRENFLTAPPLPLSTRPLHLLILGGSQGARAINAALMELIPQLLQQVPDLHVTHQTGKSDWERVETSYRRCSNPNIGAVPFIDDMVSAYQKASLVICRAGALTVSELIQMGRPAIFVPYPRQGQNDQTANARFVETAGAARVIEQGPHFEERLKLAVESLLKPQILEEMAQKTSRLRSASGLATIGSQIEAALR